MLYNQANVFSYLKMFAPWLYYFHNNFSKTILSHPLINIQLQQMIVYVKTENVIVSSFFRWGGKPNLNIVT